MQPTRTIFNSFEGFKTEIRRIFGNSNELEVAEDKIFNLKQTGSALKYATEFRRYAGTTKWDDTAIMSHYRKGLKPEVRLELERSAESVDLNDLIQDSIESDDRLYRYRQSQRSYKPQGNQKQGRYRKNEGRPRYNPQRYGDPMELDATHHKSGNDDPEKKRRRENNLCFECGKAGHRAAECRSKKTGGKKGNFKNKFGKGQLNATFTPQLCAVSITELATPPPAYEEELEEEEVEGLSWVNRDPQLGELWSIREIDQWNRRIWRFENTDEGTINYDLSVADAEEGESYEVQYVDQHRILWFGITTNTSFVERISEEHLEWPGQGELWEVFYYHTSENNEDQTLFLCRKVGEEYRVQAQAILPPSVVGTVMRVTRGMCRYTLWKDLFDDKTRLGTNAVYLGEEEFRRVTLEDEIIQNNENE
ncbi:hypothetical protein BofuT4_P115230.1 [Botrytis cinerea T4]|uniref:CCHC-type domain-containing protein n=1 Tax=Botryotinia fuckeliana (strain T4) TaxID=999810 RepID=G2Y2C7_BOTF4|nr:hypothetical protein BofuT4_P115230.1 [Botrytis cinerea T4]